MKMSPYSPPRLVFWETTAGCNLACIHCRRITVADQLLPQDLTTGEAFELIVGRPAAESTYAGIIRLVEEAARSRAPMSATLPRRRRRCLRFVRG